METAADKPAPPAVKAEVKTEAPPIQPPPPPPPQPRHGASGAEPTAKGPETWPGRAITALPSEPA